MRKLIVYLMIILVVIIININLVKVVYGQECPSFRSFLGNHVQIKSNRMVIVTAWFSPISIDWDTFRTLCYDPNPDYWHIGLANRVRYMFNLKSYSIVSKYIDDDLKRVATVVKFYLEDSKNYNSEKGELFFVDIFKTSGNGFFDEVIVDSDLKIYYAKPYASISCYKKHLVWENPSYSQAPSKYYLYFKIPITVNIFGIPSTMKVKVRVGGYSYDFRSDESRIIYAREEESMSTEEIVYENDEIRYYCENNKVEISCDIREIDFEYSKQVKITLESNIDAKIFVDSIEYSTPTYFWWDYGSSHDIEAISQMLKFQKNDSRTIYVFERWSDGVANLKRTIIVEKPDTIGTYYTEKVEFLVSASSAYGHIEGEGWYLNGSIARLEISELVKEKNIFYIPLNNRTRVVFLRWEYDSKIFNEPILQINVEKPIKACVIWKKQYLVNVATEYGTATGSGWYDENSDAIINITGLTSEAGLIYVLETDNIRYVFMGWHGDITSTSPNLRIIVDRPLDIEADFKRQYLVIIKTNKGELSYWVFENEYLEPNVERHIYGLVSYHLRGFKDKEGNVYGYIILVDKPLVLEPIYEKDYTFLIVLILATVFIFAILSFFVIKVDNFPLYRVLLSKIIKTAKPLPPPAEEETRVYGLLGEYEEETRVYGISEETTEILSEETQVRKNQENNIKE